MVKQHNKALALACLATACVVVFGLAQANEAGHAARGDGDLESFAMESQWMDRKSERERQEFLVHLGRALAAAEFDDSLRRPGTLETIASNCASWHPIIQTACMAVMSEDPKSKEVLLRAIHAWEQDPALAFASLKAVSDSPSQEYAQAVDAILSSKTAPKYLIDACDDYERCTRAISGFALMPSDESRIQYLFNTLESPVQVLRGELPLGVCPLILWACRALLVFPPELVAQRLYERGAYPATGSEYRGEELSRRKLARQKAIAVYLDGHARQVWTELVLADPSLAPYLER